MAAARKVAALIKELETEEQWEELMEVSEKKLIRTWRNAGPATARCRPSTRGPLTLQTVIDVYKEWCGPCEVMMPTYERIFLDNEECEKRIEFRTVRPQRGRRKCISAKHALFRPLLARLAQERLREPLTAPPRFPRSVTRPRSRP